jgi:DNA-binding transcriptional regulator YiaG
MRQLKFRFEADCDAVQAQDARRTDTDRREWPLLIRRLRWQLGLSQAQFANAYRIDLARLADAESGAAEPDEALAAYLVMIDRTPELIARMWMAAA